MINMSYCMCKNTYLAFHEVLDRLGDGFKLSCEEADAFADLLKLVLEYCDDNWLIDGIGSDLYDKIEEHVKSFIDGEDEEN